MRQFYEAYRGNEKVSPLVRQLPWTHHLIILGQAKPPETREFYILAAIKDRWTKRELERQIQSGAVLRRHVATRKGSDALARTHPSALAEFKNAYNLEFLSLADGHSEADLHRALLTNLGRFIAELGRDFCFVGSEYPIQVGNHDFAIDLVFFHRGLSCLVAFELKVGRFEPEHLGKLSFYVEALDRDMKKDHERPAIGVLLCASKDDEVVEYALARTTSPTLVANTRRCSRPRRCFGKSSTSFTRSLRPAGRQSFVTTRTMKSFSRVLLAAGEDASDAAKRAQSLREKGHTAVFIAVDGVLVGMLGVVDPIKDTTVDAIRQLKSIGLRIVMLTGDNETAARAIAREVGIDEVRAGVLPDGKAAVVDELQRAGAFVAMAGDGINDAPALAKANVGVAMGTGTDVAIEGAGTTLVKGDLRGLVRARSLSRAVMRNIRQNLVLAFVYNALGIPLAAGVLYPRSAFCSA